MWLKFLLGAAIVAFCILIGYVAADRYRERKKFYAQFSAFNERYLTELSYARKPLSEFIGAYKYSGAFEKLLRAHTEKREGIRCGFLTKDEQAEADDYFAMLGKGDAQSQKGYFASKKSALEEKKESSAREAASRNALYLKLGLLAGLAIVILIV